MPEPTQPKSGKLNPFAFPDETETRFTLLIITAVLVAVNLAYHLLMIYNDSVGGTILSFEEYEEPDLDLPADEYFRQARQNSLAQLRQYDALLVPLVLAGSVLWTANRIYRRHPKNLQKRLKLGPLMAEQDRLLYEKSRELAAQVGLSPPGVMIARDDRADGQAYGLKGNYLIRLGYQTRFMLRRAPQLFSSLFLHELGHIANRDIWRTYFAQALWVAVIVLVHLPFLLVVVVFIYMGLAKDLTSLGISAGFLRSVFVDRLPAYFFTLLQAGCLLLVIYLVQAGILRVREFYADWRANLWGAGEGLGEILHRQESTGKASRLPYFFRRHPTHAQRLEILRNPYGLFVVSLEAALFSGILIGLIMAGFLWVLAVGQAMLVLSIFLTSVLGGAAVTMVGAAAIATRLGEVLYLLVTVILAAIVFLPILAISFLVTNVIGTEITREAVADLAINPRRGARYLRLFPLGLLFLLGAEIGLWISPLSVLVPPDILSALRAFAWWLAFLPPIWMVFVTVRYLSRRWIGLHTGAKLPAGKRRVLVFFSSLLLWIVLSAYMLGRLFLVLPISSNTIFKDTATLVIFSLSLWLGAIFLVALAMAVAWVFAKLARLVAPPKCPHCGRAVREGHAVGVECAHCHQDLAEWLIVKEAQ